MRQLQHLMLIRLLGPDNCWRHPQSFGCGSHIGALRCITLGRLAVCEWMSSNVPISWGAEPSRNNDGGDMETIMKSLLLCLTLWSAHGLFDTHSPSTQSGDFNTTSTSKCRKWQKVRGQTKESGITAKT